MTTQLSDEVAVFQKTRSPIYLLARNVGDYVFKKLREAENESAANNDKELLKAAWEKIIHVLCLFNVQLVLKHKQEIGRDGVVRFAFFVSNGLPRPTSSFKLPARFVEEFFKLEDKWRARITKNFQENKAWVGSPVPLTNFDDPDMISFAEGTVLTE